jgi:hypothetical protein
MKKQLTTLCLFAMAFGALQLPATAFDFGVSVFNKYDHNHDGRWNYRDFNDANRYYYQTHPQAVIINNRDLRRDFNRLDTDNDGYVNVEEVRTYHTWE